MEAQAGSLKRTPLSEVHRRMGARMVPFAGWEMPVQYGSILEEHRAVRTRAGLFDISHMGEIEIKGKDALAFVQFLTTNDASLLEVGRVQYSALLYEDGTFVDDITVYRLGGDHFMFTVNAANADKDYEWITSHLRGNVGVKNLSDEKALLAIQGPKAEQILQRLTPVDLSQVRYYWFAWGLILGFPALLSRTGYTGEDGFEIYLENAAAEPVWQRILEAGKDVGVVPVGLGARDTLRLEAKMALYGSDIDDKHTMLEADLERYVKFDKGEFIGKEALLKQKQEGMKRKLVGFEMVGRGIPRSHYKIAKEGREIGEVTSGGYAPWLEKNIGLGYVPIDLSEIGAEFDIVIRGQAVPARVVPTPFYKRRRS
mgnify:CR=1 FL=1